MKFEKKRASTKQEIPTASMPDIIFMLLLFFMVTTTLREVEVLVNYALPEAKAIEKIEKKCDQFRLLQKGNFYPEDISKGSTSLKKEKKEK